MKPNLFIVGAPKCGTTAWVSYLSSHPSIFFSPVKEVHYFCTDLRGFSAVTEEKDYLRLFSGAKSGQVVGEASVMYLFSETAAEEIYKFNPDAKILIFLRNQETFLPSLHHQFLYNFMESITDFGEAWRLRKHRSGANVPATCKEPRVLDYEAMGRFSEQVERYYSRFPAANVRVFHFEDWTNDPRAAYLEIMRLLQIEDDGRTDFPSVNEAKSHRSKLLGRLIVHPPRWARNIAGIVKRMLGVPTLGLAETAVRLIAEPGYKTSIDPSLRDEIRRCYEEENARLLNRLWRPSQCQSANTPPSGGAVSAGAARLSSARDEVRI